MLNNRYYSVPDVITGYPLDDVISVVMPEETTNLIANPSFELGTTGYVAVDTFLTRTAAWQRRGAYGLQITPNAGVVAGVYYAVDLIQNQPYTFSIDFQGDAGKIYNIYFAHSGSGAVQQNYSFKANGFKQRVWVTYVAYSTATRWLYLTRNAYSDTSPFYTDGWQCENKAYPTTYCDGDQQGYVIGETAYLWNGTPHASTSWRSRQTASGGKMVKLADLGFTLLAILGLGMGPVNPIALPSSQGGAFYQNTIDGIRQFTLVGSIQGTAPGSDLQRIRKGLIDAFKPDRTAIKQELLLQYQAMDECGNPTGDLLNIPCHYQDGLPGQVDNKFQERIGLQFEMFLPLVMGEGEEGANLSFNKTVANANYILMRDKNGSWQAMGSGMDGMVNALAIAPDGTLYAAGSFLNAGGVPVNYIAKWNAATGLWEQLGTGLDGSAEALAIDSNGVVYVGGAFSHAGGVAAAYIAYWDGSWHAMGTGMDLMVNALAVGLNNYLYAGGGFIHSGGVLTNQIAYWDGANWHAMGTGMNGTVYAITILSTNAIYAGGNFSTAGGVSANYIARWNGASWFPLGSGMNDTVSSLALSPEPALYASGLFTTAGGLAAAQIARWNGAGWSPLGSGLNQYAESMVFLPNGLMYASGYFTVAGGLTLPDNSAIWNGTSWVYFDVDEHPGSPASNNAMVVDKAGNLYVGFSLSGSALASANTTVTNHGTDEVQPIIRFTGIGTLYQLKNVTTGKAIYFNLTLLAGEVATLNLEKGTFVSNFRGNLRSAILPGSDESFSLLSGDNIISLFIGGTTDAYTAAVIYWTDKYRSIDGAVR